MRFGLLLESDQRRLLEAFRQSRDKGAGAAPYVAADPAWPPHVVRQAAADLDRATETGRVGPGDLVLFTSGSTGHPRAVVRTWASWQASLGPLTAVTGIGAGDVVWLPGALSSSLFLYAAYHADAVDARLVLRDEEVTGDVTAAHCVPIQAVGILGRIARGELPGLRTLVVAGDRLGADAWRLAADCAVRVIEYYGAAELSFVGVRDRLGPFAPFPQVEVEGRGLNAGVGSGAPRPEGQQPGRAVLWCRSPYLSQGYLDPDRGGPLRRDSDGWASVGDLVAAAEAPGGLGPTGPVATGRSCAGFDVVGRGEDAVTIGGHTVLVRDVEDEIRRLPGVRDVAVVGLPHARLGASLAAMVAADPGLTVARLRSESRNVSDWSRVGRPRRWIVVDHLPRTPGGKVDRVAVRRALGSADDRPVASGGDSADAPRPDNPDPGPDAERPG